MRRVGFFLRLFAWFSLRNLRNHRWRAITVLLGIALGAAVFTSVRLAVHASLASFTHSMELVAGRADRVVMRPADRIPENLIGPLLRHPAVHAASPVMTAYVQPAGPAGEAFLLIGIDPVLDRAFRSWRSEHADIGTAALDLLREPFTLIVGQRLAADHGWSAGSRVVLAHVRQRVPFRVLGVLAAQGLAQAEGGRVAVTDIATFQEFTQVFDRVDRIDLALKPAAGVEDIRSLARLLPEGVRLAAPGEVRASGRGMIRAYQINLSVLSFASLFVGMFLVYSLVAVNAAARRHELAVLRATGASARLLFLIFLAEGALFGIAGWLAAIPVSSLLVRYFLGGISRTITDLFVRVQVDRVTLNGGEILLSFALTLAVAVLAALQPAREAMRVPPIEALSMAPAGNQRGNGLGRIAARGGFLILLVWPLSRIPGADGFPWPGYLATFFLFTGSALTAPWALQRLGTHLAPWLRRLAGEPAYLAGRYVRDSGIRTAVSVGALITAVALFCSLVIMVHSFRQTVEHWVSQTVNGDLFVSPKMGELNRYQDSFPPDLVRAFKRLRTPVDLVPFRRFYLHHGAVPYQFEALDLGVFLRHSAFIWLRGDPAEKRSRLIAGEGVVVSEVFANRTGLGVGDRFEAQIQSRRVNLPVLGVIRDYRTQGGVVFFALPAFEQGAARGEGEQWSGVRIFLRDRTGDIAAGVRALRREILENTRYDLDLISGRDLRAEILRIFDETFAVTTLLLLISLVVAALGIATTLTVLVLERSRQLNILFAVGASFGQIRSMIFWEASLLVVAGEVGGLLCGFALSWLLVFVINRQSFGWTFLYSVDWGALGLSIPLIFLTSLLAALPATQLVFRQPPAALLQER